MKGGHILSFFLYTFHLLSFHCFLPPRRRSCFHYFSFARRFCHRHAFYPLSSCCHGALRWQRVGSCRSFFLMATLIPRPSVPTLSCQGGREGAEVGLREMQVNRRRAPNPSFSLRVFSPPSKGLWHRGAVREVRANRPPLGKRAGRRSVRAPLHARRWAPTPEGKSIYAAAWSTS